MLNRKPIKQSVRNVLFSALNKEFLIFLFFLALSAGFWMMMTLNETTEGEFTIPVRLTGTPRNAVMTTPLPDSVRITLRDKGFTLLAYAYGNTFRSLSFKFSQHANEDKGSGVIPLTEVQKQIQTQLYGSTRLVSVKPDKLDFYFSYGASKQVPVRFKGKVTTSKSHYLARTEFNPQKITVYANKKMLDALKYVEIEPYNVYNLQDTLHQEVKLQTVKGLKTVPSTVKLSLYPDVLTEETVEVPVTAINMPANMVLRTFPSRVTVRFTIGASLFRTINPAMFTVAVDYKDIVKNPSDKCTLQLRNVPHSVMKARLDIQTVDYLLEQQ